ncbi:hypothetical protein SISNIDRAFT_486571 [Sistotremastrum niveocremeum HHB9708]|uniref:Uncharacterized protein n=2 Tax=Sistotremastraceae TaxID=3402574 RepID=A0A164TQ88_9AGAM|nr:hypothetical protein SISNIDRAFT_486571 [Sistotremastrum niveocremeum HHB9708]KZT42217.1 hypothetical protein SISSUDRAFT_1058820 [Sistotremastrum suecicum HHB10207 ss-3]
MNTSIFRDETRPHTEYRNGNYEHGIETVFAVSCNPASGVQIEEAHSDSLDEGVVERGGERTNESLSESDFEVEPFPSLPWSGLGPLQFDGHNLAQPVPKNTGITPALQNSIIDTCRLNEASEELFESFVKVRIQASPPPLLTNQKQVLENVDANVAVAQAMHFASTLSHVQLSHELLRSVKLQNDLLASIEEQSRLTSSRANSGERVRVTSP